ISICVLPRCSVAGVVLLPKIEQKIQDPLISQQLVGEPVIRRASLTVLLFAAVLFGLIVQLPLFFQTALHTSATVSALLLIPLTLARVIVSTATGLKISATGHPRPPMAAGLSIVTVAFFVLAAGIELGPVFIAPVTFAIFRTTQALQLVKWCDRTTFAGRIAIALKVWGYYSQSYWARP